MSIRKELYNKTVEKLDSLSMYQTIDLNKGQINNPQKNYPISYPAALISIDQINWQDMTFNTQEGNVILNVYLFFERFGDTFKGASDKENSLEILDQIHTTAQSLQWLYSENYFTELNLISEEDLTQNFDRPAFKISFSTNCFQKLKIPNYVHN